MKTPQVKGSVPWEVTTSDANQMSQVSGFLQRLSDRGSRDLWIQLFARTALRTQENTYLCSEVYCIIKIRQSIQMNHQMMRYTGEESGRSQHRCPVPQDSGASPSWYGQAHAYVRKPLKKSQPRGVWTASRLVNQPPSRPPRAASLEQRHSYVSGNSKGFRSPVSGMGQANYLNKRWSQNALIT